MGPNVKVIALDDTERDNDKYYYGMGHRHINAITPQPSKDPTHPELGFWVVETPSLKDFLQQFRTFDIVHFSLLSVHCSLIPIS